MFHQINRALFQMKVQSVDTKKKNSNVNYFGYKKKLPNSRTVVFCS